MNNLNLLCQTIRFQRTALQNSLAMISAVQQHGEKFLKSTFEQSPWIPGQGKDACLFWAGIWTKNLTGVTQLVDKNLATMERFTSTGEEKAKSERKEKPAEKPAAESTPQPSMEMKQAAPDTQQPAEKSQPCDKEMPPPKATEQTALVKTEAQQEQLPGKFPEQFSGKKPEKSAANREKKVRAEDLPGAEKSTSPD